MLGGYPYRFDRASIAALLDGMLQAPAFEIQARARVRRALDSYRTGSADFADYLIGEENRHAGRGDTVTFDRRLGTAAGFAVLATSPR